MLLFNYIDKVYNEFMSFLNNWKLFYSEKNEDLSKLNFLPFFDRVKIPTLFENELYRNHVLGNPYHSINNWEYQKYESYHQYYKKEFVSKKKSLFIKFNGIDTIADIILNGTLIGKTSNCFLPYVFKLNNLKEKNELIVHIYPSVEEGLKHDFSKICQVAKYNFESLYIRKPASSFGWDILPRTPLGGIHKTIELLDDLPIIEDFYINPTFVSREKAVLKISANKKDGIYFRVNGICEDSSFDCEFVSKTEIELENPKLWTIRGYGKQNLYNVTVSAIKDGIIIEKKTIKYGIRKIELERTSVVEDNGMFNFKINGQKVFILGSNWVPVDAIKHIDVKRAKKALKMLVDIGCNAIRIWGGGTYEDEKVYSLCDELGIFIWQDFMMGCATYPQDKNFCAQIKNEAEIIVKQLRNHCSVCLWAGDNENDLACCFWATKKSNPNKNVLTRRIIPDVLSLYDKSRPYLPSSPYIDEYAYAHKDMQLSEDHLWGPRDYFKGEYYKTVYPYFTSETGYHALNSIKSLKKFINNPWPLFDKNGNPTKEYMCHGVTVKDDVDSPYLFRTRLMYDQVKTLFKGEINNLRDFVVASQISQAEAMKYFIEKMRRDTDRNGGIIWWNILDGWPQVSDAVVDYYFNKKIAYNYIKKSQQNVLIFMDEEESKEKLYVSSLLDYDCDISYYIYDAYTNEKVKKGNITCKARKSILFDNFNNDGKQHFYIIKYKINGKSFINSFHTNVINLDFERYVKVLNRLNRFK